jgi:uncharacterized membrane protein YhaH (DUF805 family)
MDWFLLALRRYAVFSGRSRRKEYWFYTLFYLIGYIIVGILDFALGTTVADDEIGILGLLYALALLVPSISVTVRRLHDTNRSGWWFLIWLVPLIGIVVGLVLMCLDSDPGDNRYGPNPKGVTPSATAPA